MPCLQMDLKTTHVQVRKHKSEHIAKWGVGTEQGGNVNVEVDLSLKKGDKLPAEDDPKPVVDCTFFTDFENHIYVTTDAEAFFFLHDIISSYVKEKERVLSIQQARWHT